MDKSEIYKFIQDFIEALHSASIDLVMLVPLVLSNRRVRFMLRGSDFLSRLANQLLRALLVYLVPAGLLVLVPVF